MNRKSFPRSPTVTGWGIGGGRVAVSCPHCGREHRHGADADMKTPGGSHRMQECGTRAESREAEGYFIKLYRRTA